MFGLMSMLFLTPGAEAAWPDDIRFTGWDSWQGNSSADAETLAGDYKSLLQELGVAIANKPTAPAHSLGSNGFQLSMDNSFSFINASGDGSNPSPWERAHEDGSPSSVLWTPRLHVRKGLPLSVDIGASTGYVALSHQTLVSGYGRFGLLEGYRQIPDINLQLGYTGYIGNEELELGVMDTQFNIGYSLPFGTQAGINETVFSPYAGFSRLAIHAAPRLPSSAQEELGLSPISGFRGADSQVEDPDLRLWQIHGGFQLVKSGFQFSTSVAYAVGLLPTVNMSLGLHY